MPWLSPDVPFMTRVKIFPGVECGYMYLAVLSQAVTKPCSFKLMYDTAVMQRAVILMCS